VNDRLRGDAFEVLALIVDRQAVCPPQASNRDPGLLPTSSRRSST
jgi:hypothetical protein